MKRAILFLFLFCSVSFHLLSQTYYVSSDGSDNNDGLSSTAACATVTNAITRKDFSTLTYTDWWWHDSERYNISQWRTACGGDGKAVSGINPGFNGSGDYNLLYGSPAKNAGTGLLSDSVLTDILNNPRPYWNKDFDIGAYEVQGDAQLKIGITNSSYDNSSFTVSSAGSYWERSSDGSFNVSQNSDLASTGVNVSADSNINNWHGWDFNWLNIGENDFNQPLALGIYNLSYDGDPSKFIYIDYRDAIDSYSPNLSILFDPINKYYYYHAGSQYLYIPNTSILRIWNVNNGGISNTNGLTDYWENSLAFVDSNDHPKLMWAPYNGGSLNNYYIYRKVSTRLQWIMIDSTSSTNFADDSESCIIGRYHHQTWYKVAANSNNQLFYTESVVIGVNGPGIYKEISPYNSKTIDYSLNQNFPNPFNPSSSIQYSIPNPGLVKIEVFDILGRRIETLVNEEKLAGEYKVTFNGSKLASGIFLYKLTSGTFCQVKKMLLLK